MRTLFAFSCIAVVGLSLGCSGDPAVPSGDPLANSEFAGEPKEGYLPRPPPCPPDLTPANLPTLPLRVRDTTELYLPSADFVPTWGVDYEVWPPHRTDGITITPDFDESRALPPRSKEGRCPTEIAAADLAVDPSIDDVIHVRVAATSESDTARDVEVFYPQGSRSVVIQPTNVAPSSDFEGDWYVVIQPLWGERRISIQRLALGAGNVTVSRVPVGPTLIHIVRTTVVEDGPVEGTLEAPAGFSELWPHLVSQWYAATLATLQSNETVTPTVVIGHGGRWQRLGLLLPQPYDATRPNTLATLANMNDPLTVSIPCGAASTLRVLGTGSARLTLGASSWNATPTVSATITPTCPSGSDHVEATLTGSSSRHLETFVSIVGGAP